MKIETATALVTGANRGIGKAIVQALLDGGAKQIFATARDPDSLTEVVAGNPGRVVPLALDITDQAQIDAARERASEVNLLINNAGIATFSGVIAAPDMTGARAEMEVNYFGTLAVTRAFAPVLKANGGGVVVNVSSIGGLVTVPVLGSYCASKAAVHAMTQGVRAELKAQGTQVIGVYPGPIDTDMASEMDMDKFPPSRVAEALLKAIVDGTEDVFPDDMSATMRAQLLEDPKAVERQFAEMLPAV